VSLLLDARQRAMLEEIGVRLFWPAEPVVDVAPAAPAQAAARQAAAPVRAEPSPPPTPAPARERQAVAPVAAGELAALGWDALQEAVAQFAAARRRKAVFGTGDLRPDWLCIGEPPLEDEEHEGLPFAGEPGRLLDNMLAAVGASRRQGAYLTNVLKCRLPQERADEAAEVAQSLAFLRRQVELLQPRVILAMGRFAVQALLSTGEPTGKLRGQVHRFHGVPVVVSFHPAYLLRTPADKARAWADLCLARSLLQAPS
jgi:DNA polymerase